MWKEKIEQSNKVGPATVFYSVHLENNEPLFAEQALTETLRGKAIEKTVPHYYAETKTMSPFASEDEAESYMYYLGSLVTRASTCISPRPRTKADLGYEAQQRANKFTIRRR